MRSANPLPPWLEDALRFSRRTVGLRAGAMHLIDDGEGLPILLLHGNPTWSFLWRKVLTRLRGSRLRLIAPDLFGFGLSDKPRRVSDHSLAFHVGAIEELVKSLALERMVIVGQDWGGPIMAAFAARNSDRVVGAVFANTAIVDPRRPLRPTTFHRFSHLPILSELAFLGLRFPVPILSRVQGDPRSIGAFERRAYAWPFRRFRDRAGPLALARMVPHREDHPSLPLFAEMDGWARSFRGPTALVWGKRDPILGRGLKRLREAMPHARVTETEAGHFLQEEVPETLAGAIAGVAAECR